MIRLGVIGLGGRMGPMVDWFREAAGGELKVVGIVDPDEAGARSRLAECDRTDVRFFATLPELVKATRPDALAIGTRCNLHAPYAIQAARYGLPLFLEKPVATSLGQALSLEKAFERSRCQVVVSFPLRVSPLCEITRRYVADGAIGRPEHVLGVNYVPYGTCYFDCFYRDFAVTQGLFLQKATHDFDYLMYLMDSRIARVAAVASWGRVFGGKKRPGLTCDRCRSAERCLESPEQRRYNRSGGRADAHPCLFSRDLGTPPHMNEDASSALLEFESGAHGVYTQVFFTRRDAGMRGATLSGYLGTLQFDWYTNRLRYVRHHAPFSDVITPDAGMAHFGGDTELCRDFVGVIRGTRRSRTPLEAGLASVYTCLAAKESAERGRFVTVRRVGQV